MWTHDVLIPEPIAVNAEQCASLGYITSAKHTCCCIKWSTKTRDKNQSPTMMASINRWSTNDNIMRSERKQAWVMISKAFHNFQPCIETTWHSWPWPEVSGTLIRCPSPNRTTLYDTAASPEPASYMAHTQAL